MTSAETNPLLRQVPPGGYWRDTAIIGGRREDDGALAAGFVEAADILVKHWKEHRPNDLLAIPILAIYRHGIELALKDAVRAATRCARRDGIDEPDLEPDAVEDRLSKTHSIGTLVEELNRWLARLELGPEEQFPAETTEVLNSLHLLDGTGQTFRYSTVKQGKGKARMLVPARPEQVHFDLPAAAAALDDAATIVLGGVSGVLEQYAQWQEEMLAESADWYK